MISYHSLIKEFVRRYPWQALGALLISFLANMLILFLPIYIAQSFDLLFGIQSHRAKILGFLPINLLESFDLYFTFFLVAVLFRGGFDYMQRYYIAYLGELHLAHLRHRIFTHQLRMKMQVYDEKGIGKYLLRYSGDLSSIQAFFTKGIIRFISDIVLLGIGLCILYHIDSRLAQLVGGIVIVLSLITYLLNKSLYRASLARRNAKSGLLKFVTARLQTVLTVKSFNRLQPETDKFQKRVNHLLKLGKDYHRIRSIIAAIIPMGLYLVIGAMMLLVVYLQSQQKTTIDSRSFFAAILLMITILPVFRRCFQVSIVWRNGSISYQKLANILNLSADEEAGRAILPDEVNSLVVNGLRYDYDNQRSLIYPEQMVFKKASMTWIQGKSGSGKSTFLRLLNGLYTPTKGRIELDGNDLEEISNKSLRRKMTIVSRDWKLLGKTVFEAISYSRKKKKRAAAQTIIDRLGLAENLSLDTRIGELGANLSSGQYQGLLYARAFLTNKPILLIDEPFAGLDQEVIPLVVSLLEERRQNSIIIFCSTREAPTEIQWDQVLQISSNVLLATPELDCS